MILSKHYFYFGVFGVLDFGVFGILTQCALWTLFEWQLPNLVQPKLAQILIFLPETFQKC